MKFWFFKQLYYVFKKITKHKFLLLFLFFVIAFFIFNDNVHAFGSEILTDGSTSATIVPTQDMFDCLSYTYNNAEVTILSALEKQYISGNTYPLIIFV